MNTIKIFYLFIALILKCLCILRNIFPQSWTATTNHPHKSSVLKDFLNLRVGKRDQTSIWHYYGYLRNPLSGGEIVAVEGLELTMRFVKDIENNCSDPLSDHEGSYISRKIFLYMDANRTDVLKSFRVRKLSPSRPLNPMKQFYELVTVSLNDSNGAFQGVVEFPSGRRLRITNGRTVFENTRQIVPVLGPFNLEIRNKVFDIVCMLKPDNRLTRPRSKWISFQSSSGDRSGRSQEYFTLSYFPGKENVSKTIMRCRRIGECPAWFAPGRTCTTELTATKYLEVAALPNKTLQLFMKVCPDLLQTPLSYSGFRDAIDPMENFVPWYKKLLNSL